MALRLLTPASFEGAITLWHRSDANLYQLGWEFLGNLLVAEDEYLHCASEGN